MAVEVDRQTIEQNVRTLTRRAARSQERAGDDRASRDQAIREALEAGIPRQRLADLTGFHPSRIDQIRRDART